LLRACLAALHLPEDAEPYRLRPPPAWRMADAIERIGGLLARVPEEGSPLAAFLPPADAGMAQTEAWSRVALAATFLAGLELAREATVVLEQPRPWTPIRLYRGPAKR
jgi:segregation and condensation protein A